MKRFWNDLVAMLALSAYSEIEGVDMISEAETNRPIFATDTEQFRLQQI